MYVALVMGLGYYTASGLYSTFSETKALHMRRRLCCLLITTGTCARCMPVALFDGNAVSVFREIETLHSTFGEGRRQNLRGCMTHRTQINLAQLYNDVSGGPRMHIAHPSNIVTLHI